MAGYERRGLAPASANPIPEAVNEASGIGSHVTLTSCGSLAIVWTACSPIWNEYAP